MVSHEENGTVTPLITLRVLENLASHRAKQLQSILPVALTIGATELEPIRESLKVRADASMVTSGLNVPDRIWILVETISWKIVTPNSSFPMLMVLREQQYGPRT